MLGPFPCEGGGAIALGVGEESLAWRFGGGARFQLSLGSATDGHLLLAPSGLL